MSGDSSLSFAAEGSAYCVSENKKLYCYGGLVSISSSQSSSKEGSMENASPARTLKEIDLESGKSLICELTAAPQATVYSTITSSNDKLFLISGFTREEGWSDDVYVYDKNLKTWSLLNIDNEADGPGPRDKHCSVIVDNNIYVFGGFGPMSEEEVEVYDQLYGIEEEKEEEEVEEKQKASSEQSKLEEPQNSAAEGNEPSEDKSNETEKSNGSRNGHSKASAVTEDKNEEDSDEDEEAGPSVSFSWYNDMWILDTTVEGKAAWSKPLYSASARPTPRAASSLCYYPKRKWLVNFGGRDHGGRRNDVNIFDVEERKWMLDVAEGGPVPPERSYHAACIFDDQLIIVGGRDTEDKELNDIFFFDLSTFLFKSVTIPKNIELTPRSCHFAAILGDKLFISGGVKDFDPELMHCRGRVENSCSIPLALFSSLCSGSNGRNGLCRSEEKAAG